VRKATLALVAALAATPVLSAQQTGSEALPVPPQAIDVQVPGGAILSFRTRGKTTVELVGTARAASARGEVKVDGKDGYLEIEIVRDKIQGLQRADRWGRDYLTYVVWVVPPGGAPVSIGEVVFREGRSEEIKARIPHQALWLLVTAEPDFAVHEPSPLAVLVSRNQSQTRTGNKARAVPGALAYHTHYSSYDASPSGALSPGVPRELRQARHAIELARRVSLLGQDASEDLSAEERSARTLLQQAQAYLEEAELRGRGDDQEQMAQLARTATQLAENARALATGAVGGLPVQQLIDAFNGLQNRHDQTQRQLTSLGDRFSQLEASLDQERGRTRELEGQLLALREQINLLQGRLEAAHQQSAQAGLERSRLCEELRRQLVSLGQLSEQGSALVLTLASDNLFDRRHTLQPAARENLAKLFVLRQMLFPRAAILFEGHTDLEGTEDYNQWLSEQRALAVYQFFLEQELVFAVIPDQRDFLQQHLSTAERLLGMSFNAARRQAAQRQEWLAGLGDAVVGKGMREPLIPEPGPNEQNRRVTLIFPQAAGGLGPFCEATAGE
jgi:outer membrane protein OmpA-like peptidoglycan-associated protein